MEEKCHIFNFESGNVSRLAGSIPRTLPSRRGKIPIDILEANIPGEALREHMPVTRSICLENTHNIWGGAVLDTDYMKLVYELAQQHHLHLHLDGARIFNAAAALKVTARDICQYCDSVMFCLSKGLAAPIGSILAGPMEFIREARKVRKYLGGGMRQVGIIAAAGIVSLERMIDRLEEDHRRAKKLAEAISDIREIDINPDHTETNFVMIKLKTMDSLTFLQRLSQKKVLALPYTDHLIRFVTHKDIDDQDVDTAARTIRNIF